MQRNRNKKNVNWHSRSDLEPYFDIDLSAPLPQITKKPSVNGEKHIKILDATLCRTHGKVIGKSTTLNDRASTQNICPATLKDLLTTGKGNF